MGVRILPRIRQVDSRLIGIASSIHEPNCPCIRVKKEYFKYNAVLNFITHGAKCICKARWAQTPTPKRVIHAAEDSQPVFVGAWHACPLTVELSGAHADV